MPRKPKKERVVAQYFVWLLGVRNGVFFADGRGNTPDLRRHSLGTRDRDEALKKIQRLDLVKAVEFSRADAAVLKHATEKLLSLEEGWRLYREYNARPAIQGGVTDSTLQRYQSVFKKFLAYAVRKKIHYWQQVLKAVLSGYGTWLNDEDYLGTTQRYELMLIKCAINWLVGEGWLPHSCNIRLSLNKVQGTTTYCYTHEQVQAIVDFCRRKPELNWLADVVFTLAYTGLRISELTGLRWSDVDFRRHLLKFTDTTRSSRKSERAEARTTKSHRPRTVPIHPDLLPILERLPHQPDDWVFHEPQGGVLKSSTVRDVLKQKVLAALAAQFPPCGDDPGIATGRLHSFRHFFCSWSADRGVTERVLMKWLGHRDSTMIRTYYHLQEDESHRQMEKLTFAVKESDARKPESSSENSGTVDTAPSRSELNG